MLSYNITETKLADLKNISLFLKQIFSKFIANKSFRLKELTVCLATTWKTNCDCF